MWRPTCAGGRADVGRIAGDGWSFDFDYRWLNEPLASAAMRGEIVRRTQGVARRAQANAPRDSGRLADSISSSAQIEGDRWVGYVSSDDPVAPYVEFGVKGRAGSHFMKRAMGDGG